MKNLFFICLLSFTSVTVWGDSLSIRSLFKEMPDTIIPYISNNNRLDFLDFMDSKMKAEITNELGGKSVMTFLSDDSLSIKLNESTRLDMYLQNTDNEVDSCHHIIVLDRTFIIDNKEQVHDIEYYSVKWRKIDALRSDYIGQNVKNTK